MGDGLQVPLRQMQVLGGRFQITVPEQNLDGAQVGACFQQVGRPTGMGNMYSLGFAPISSMVWSSSCTTGAKLGIGLRASRNPGGGDDMGERGRTIVQLSYSVKSGFLQSM